MTKERLILTDCDGTIVDWNKAFEDFMHRKGYPKIPGTDQDYSIVVRHNVSDQQTKEFVTEFNESSQISTLEPFADSVEYIKKLSNKGFRFIAVTSVSDLPQVKHYRTQNLKNLFGDIFDEIHCLEMGACKSNILLKWANTGYFWIEDHKIQAESGRIAGLQPILINHPYNSDYTDALFPKVSCTTPWKEIYKIICEDYKLET